MLIRVDTASSVPVYAQIISQIKNAVASGLLRPGDYLPSLREASHLLRVNPNTVVKAYRELESQGVVRTEHGRGTVVTEQSALAGEAHRLDVLQRQADQLVVEGYHLGASPDEIAEVVCRALGSFEEQFRNRDTGREKSDG